MLLRALVALPELKLRVLTGEDALDRRITGIYTTDLLDPSRYLSGGEIVLSGLMWRRAPADSETFVQALAQAGVAVLAAGDAAFGLVPGDLVEACRRHQIPLLEVPVEVSFAAITERVMRELLPNDELGLDAVRQRLLAGARAGGAGRAATLETGTSEGVGKLFAVARAEYGLSAWVVSAVGRVVAGLLPEASGQPLEADGETWSRLAAGYLSVPALPATLPVGDALFSLFPVGDSPAHRLAGWFVAFAGDHETWDEDRGTVAAELTELVAEFRARREEARRAARRSADDLLRRLLAWGVDEPGPGARETAAREAREIVAVMRRCGLSPAQPVAAVAATLSGVAEAQTVARVLLEELVPGAVVGVSGTDVVAIAGGAEAGLAGVFAAAATVRAGEPGLDLALGVSDRPRGSHGDEPGPAGLPGVGTAAPQPAEGMGEAAARLAADALSRVAGEARQAASAARLLGGGVRVVDASQLGSHGLLLAMVPQEARRVFHRKLLSPVLAYDSEHKTNLLRTLEVFLGCSGSWTKTAQRMFVHVNSLRYRVRRIEELTGRDLGSLADQVDLLLALQLMRETPDDYRVGAGDRRSAVGDRRAAARDRGPAARDQGSAAQDQGADPLSNGGIETSQP